MSLGTIRNALVKTGAGPALLSLDVERSDAALPVRDAKPESPSLTPLLPAKTIPAPPDVPVEQGENSAHSALTERLGSIQKNHAKAMDAGVDSARKSFAMKALGIGLAALGVAVVVSLTVATGGAALAAAAAAAGVVFAVSVADAGCAYMNLKNAQAAKEGKPQPYDLPAGSSSIGNVANYMFKAMGASDERAKMLAGWTDGLLRIGMGIATAVCTMGVTVGADSFERIAPIVAAAVNLTQSLVDLGLNRYTSRVLGKSTATIKSDFEMASHHIEKMEREIKTGWQEGAIETAEARDALQTIAEFRIELAHGQVRIEEDLQAVSQLTPGVVADAGLVFPSAAVVVMAVLPGFEAFMPDLVHVSPKGGNAGAVNGNFDGRAGMQDPYAMA